MLSKIICGLLCLCLFTSNLEAGKSGTSSSSSRSSGSGFSGSRSTSSSKPSMPSSSSRSSNSGFKTSSPPKQSATPSSSQRGSTSGFSKQNGSTGGTKSTTTKSVVDNKVNKMVKVGNTNMTKDQAISKFRTEHASTYTSKYSSEPSSRPSHIPPTYNHGGNTYNISYNRGMGGYGYYGPNGAWMMYDTMRDVAMMSMLMNNHGYRDVIVTQPGVVNTEGAVVSPQGVVVYRNPYHGFFLGFIFILAIMVVLVFIFRTC